MRKYRLFSLFCSGLGDIPAVVWVSGQVIAGLVSQSMICEPVGLDTSVQISPRFNQVVFATGNQRCQNRRTVSGALAADQQPVLAANGDSKFNVFRQR